ncbi:hypothetical protein EV644_120116 [Kribbella orskensis]|uniref:MYXO-CTERM domain-containing protein n=1 Tax=Kribbella orskensis TaxID=2512216 RepID=A0ABY2BDR7_9ACTN|nr:MULTISPECIES: hypothetical protein [Kribbella]TCN34202.1 hypothetical protein EV642_1223 [Kribbella sp. VKM Ac-2500]TCO14492.1 hypothetical protein EV644_120116 [Kribbella orskensis]
MNHTYSALALSALALGTVVLTTPEASALLRDTGGASAPYSGSTDDWPGKGSGYPESKPTNCACPGHPLCSADPMPEFEVVAATTPAASSDVTWSASAQMGTSALGGAALAFGGMWLYRRRTPAD